MGKKKAPQIQVPYLIVAIPCRDQIRHLAFIHMVGAMMYAEKFWKKIHGEDAKFGYLSIGGVQAAEARQTLFNEAARVGATWILWIDDDMAPPEDLLRHLWQATAMSTIVTGFYWRKGGECLSTVGRFPPVGPCNWIEPSDMKLPYETVDAMGFGCCLTKVETIAAVAVFTNGHPFLTQPGCTEDVYFANAAKQLGFTVTACRDVHCGHVGEHVFTKADRDTHIAAAATKAAEAVK